MRMWNWMVALLAVACIGTAVPALSAQDMGKEKKPAGEEKKNAAGEEKKDESKEEPAEDDPVANLKATFKDVDQVIKDVTLTQEDIDSYVKHNESFDKAMDEDEKFQELADKNIKKAFDYAVKSEKYKAWADKEGVKAEDWLRKAVRIMVLNFKISMTAGADEQIKELEDQKKLIESMKEMLSEEEYKETIAALDEGLATGKGMKEVADGLPAPSDAEKKLLEDNADKIESAGGSDEDSEDGEDGEDEDDDDDMG